MYKSISKKDGVSYPVLVPTVKYLKEALSYGVKEVAIFGAASEAFTQKNIKCSIVILFRKVTGRKSGQISGAYDYCYKARHQSARICVLCHGLPI